MSRLPWVKTSRGGSGKSIIYHGQYFWSNWSGDREHLYYKQPDWWGREGFIGSFTGCCHFCGLGIDDAVRRFKPTKKTRTEFTVWKKCELGFCGRMTVSMNGYQYWAKHFPEKRKVAIYDSHLGRTPIGYLPETAVPLYLRREMR